MRLIFFATPCFWHFYVLFRVTPWKGDEDKMKFSKNLEKELKRMTTRFPEYKPCVSNENFWNINDKTAQIFLSFHHVPMNILMHASRSTFGASLM